MIRRAWPGAAAAVALAAPLLLWRLGAAGFDDPGEGMHAEIAREMMAQADPLATTLNGVPYLDKPPLLYWMQSAAFALAGPGEGTARAASVAGALVAVGATAWLGGRLLGAPAGLLAGLALLTSPLFFAFGRYVRPETLFVGALAAGFALALAALVRAGEAAGGARAGGAPRALGALALVAFGVAGLAKDPVGAIAPLPALALALAVTGRAGDARRLWSWPAAAACLVLAGAWWVVAEVRTPGALWYTFVDNKVLNVAGARLFPDEDVPLSALEFLVVAVLGALPWSAAAGVGVLALARRRAWRLPSEAPWVALALWALGVLVLTSFSRLRLPHYGLPAYPALALLAARAWAETSPRRLVRVHLLLFTLLGVGCGLAWASDGRVFESLVLGATDVASRKTAAAGQAAPLPPWEALRPHVGHAAAAFGGGAVLTFLAVLAPARFRRTAPAAAVAVTMLALLPAASSALASVADHRSAREVGRIIRERAAPDDLVVHEGPIEGSGALEWYSGRRPIIVDGRRSVLGFGATLPGAEGMFWTADDLRRAWNRSPGRIWVVTTRAPERSAAAALPGAALAHARGGRWLYVREAP